MITGDKDATGILTACDAMVNVTASCAYIRWRSCATSWLSGIDKGVAPAVLPTLRKGRSVEYNKHTTLTTSNQL